MENKYMQPDVKFHFKLVVTPHPLFEMHASRQYTVRSLKHEP
jgi:hypothetical protein